MTAQFAAPQTAKPPARPPARPLVDIVTSAAAMNAVLAGGRTTTLGVGAPGGGQAKLDFPAVPGEVKVVGRDHTVFVEDDAATAIYQIVEGMIRLCKLLPDGRRHIIGFLGAGEVAGLAAAERFGYSAETVTSATLKRIPRARMDNLVKENPAALRLFLAATTAELVMAQNQMLLLGRKTARERIASFLLGRLDKATGQLRRVNVPMSRTDIADHLGLTTETVSREFTRLKTARLIRLLEGGWVELLDLKALSELAGGA